jgi:hypothetical protein
MPKSTVKKSRLFREFSKLPDKYVKHNYLKNLRGATNDFLEKNDKLTKSYLHFMLFVYDLEFFTIDYISVEYGYSRNALADRVIYPLLRDEYLYKHFDKLTPSTTMEDHLFRDETKFNYRVRYALSQRGRMAVQRFYNSL